MRVSKNFLSMTSVGVFILYILVVCPLGVAMGEETPKTISISSEEYPPYTSEKLKDYGIDAAIVTAAFKHEGIKTIFSFYPGARSYKMAQGGDVDASLPWAKRKGRELDFYYSAPVIKVDVEHLYFQKRAPIKWDPLNSNFEHLKGVTIAATIGHNYGEDFQNAEKTGNIETVRLKSLKQGLQMLLAGRVNALISKRHVVIPALKENFTAEQRNKLNSLPLSQAAPSYDYMLISRKGKHGEYFRDAFARGLDKLHKSGEYQRLMDAFIQGAYNN